ncbi:hypothetical protein D9M69_512660 [compost metagenome]
MPLRNVCPSGCRGARERKESPPAPAQQIYEPYGCKGSINETSHRIRWLLFVRPVHLRRIRRRRRQLPEDPRGRGRLDRRGRHHRRRQRTARQPRLPDHPDPGIAADHLRRYPEETGRRLPRLLEADHGRQHQAVPGFQIGQGRRRALAERRHRRARRAHLHRRAGPAHLRRYREVQGPVGRQDLRHRIRLRRQHRDPEDDRHQPVRPG